MLTSTWKLHLAALAALLYVLTGAHSSYAKCDPTTDPDKTDIASARAAVAARCNCTGELRHGAYVSCAAQQANAVLTNKSCTGFVKKCASHSTCGKPNAVHLLSDHDQGHVVQGQAGCRALHRKAGDRRELHELLRCVPGTGWRAELPSAEHDYKHHDYDQHDEHDDHHHHTRVLLRHAVGPVLWRIVFNRLPLHFCRISSHVRMHRQSVLWLPAVRQRSVRSQRCGRYLRRGPVPTRV
jgi:hypothetical protein